MIIEIPGIPISKQRHRYFVNHGRIVSYDPQEHAKKAIRKIMEIKMRKAINHRDRKIAIEASNLATSDIFEVNLTFHLPFPKNSTNGKKNLFTWIGIPTAKPDIDNLAKFYLDCANGVIWNDDRQIISLNLKKIYTNKPKTTIKIIGSKNMTLHDTAAGILSVFSQQDFQELTETIQEGYENILKIVKTDQGTDYQAERDIQQYYAKGAALLLSLIADKYADKLSKIKKRYPDFWRQFPEIESKCKAALHQEEYYENTVD